MGYKVVDTGPQFPNGYEVNASTAAEAEQKLKAVRHLCGQATVRGANGREISLSELARLVQVERDAQRDQLRGRRS